MNEVVLCEYCGKPVKEDYNFMLDHTAGLYVEDKDPTIVREGVFCTRGCLTRWLLETKAGEEGGGPMKLKELVDEVRSIANEGKMDATDSTLFVYIVAEAWNRLEGRRMSGRTASILISEIGHDLDEIVTGWSQKEDALIKVGLNDARRDSAELSKLMAKAAA